MTREEKISAIYKEMANKELTFGCKLQVIESVGPIQGVIFNVVSEEYKVLRDDGRRTTETKNTDYSVIGHPVMIGDVLHWTGEKKFNANAKIPGFGFEDSESLDDESKLWLIQNHYSGRVCASWLDKRTPIEDQSDECIDYVYSLMQKD